MIAYARRLKNDVSALYFALQDPRTPFYAKILMWIIVAYAFSPIDLIPDFIPVLGYLDDLLLLPLGIALVIRWIPPEVMADARTRAAAETFHAASWLGAVLIGSIWMGLLLGGIKLIL